jgi:hypothetical protein
MKSFSTPKGRLHTDLHAVLKRRYGCVVDSHPSCALIVKVGYTMAEWSWWSWLSHSTFEMSMVRMVVVGTSTTLWNLRCCSSIVGSQCRSFNNSEQFRIAVLLWRIYQRSRFVISDGMQNLKAFIIDRVRSGWKSLLRAWRHEMNLEISVHYLWILSTPGSMLLKIHGQWNDSGFRYVDDMLPPDGFMQAQS